MSVTIETNLENFGNKYGKIVEENNNELDMLTANFQGMGNIADSCKNAMEKSESNCIESKTKVEAQDSVEYDYGSDEFEEDIGDDVEDPQVTTIEVHPPKNDTQRSSSKSSKKTDTARSIPEKEKIHPTPPCVPITPTPRKTSSNSTLFSSSSAGKPRRLNMSFTNDKVREIHRENFILASKVMRVKRSNLSQTNSTTSMRESSSAISRRRNQEKADFENMILLRKIRGVKSSNLSFRR